jgi:hypothetical protein
MIEDGSGNLLTADVQPCSWWPSAATSSKRGCKRCARASANWRSRNWPTLEGHYLAGYGDHTTRVTELVPITPTAGSLDEAESIVRAHPDDAARIDRLLELASRHPKITKGSTRRTTTQ